jgi:5-methylthioribose kinase
MELNPKNIPDYLRKRQQEIGIFESGAEIVTEEIGDGNLNFVFRVYDANEPSNSIILKQAPPYIKILGPSFELTPDRLTYESRALEVYNQLVPAYAPHQKYFDPENYVIGMADLKGYRILRSDLIEGIVNLRVPEHIARFMAITHSRTHVRNLSPEVIENYASCFKNRVMQGITADYVFTKPYIDDPTNFHTEGLESYVNALKSDQQLLAQIDHFKRIFCDSEQGLTHGDLHTGSVMVLGDSAKVIDAEFVFYGSVGFDLGLFWANYLLAYCSHVGNDAGRVQLKDAILRTWETYEAAFEMDDAELKTESLKQIFDESVGFAGVEMMRRLIGAAHVADIEGISDIEKKLSIETNALEFGRKLVKNHDDIRTVSELVME